MPTCGILGLPMSVASTVPSMTHLISLTTYEEKQVEEGIRKEPVKVVEQRATNFIIHLLLGFSLFMAPVLRLLPKSVLYGVFFYMGISSLTGNALFNRMCLWMIWDTTKYPNYHFLGDHMSIRRVHLYTAIQAMTVWKRIRELQNVLNAKPHIYRPNLGRSLPYPRGGVPCHALRPEDDLGAGCCKDVVGFFGERPGF